MYSYEFSVRLEPTKLILIGTRTTYQATTDDSTFVQPALISLIAHFLMYQVAYTADRTGRRPAASPLYVRIPYALCTST